MTISDIMHTEAQLGCKATAVSNLFPPIHRQAFESTLDGILGDRSYEDKKQAAYNWMNENYELVSAVIYAAIELTEDIYTGLCDLDSMLSEFGKQEEQTGANLPL